MHNCNITFLISHKHIAKQLIIYLSSWDYVTNKVAVACTTRQLDAYAYPHNNAITKIARLRLLRRAWLTTGNIADRTRRRHFFPWVTVPFFRATLEYLTCYYKPYVYLIEKDVLFNLLDNEDEICRTTVRKIRKYVKNGVKWLAFIKLHVKLINK